MATFVQDTDVRPGPNRYVSDPGVATIVPKYLEDYAHPVIITGEKSAKAFLDYNGTGEFFAPALRYDGSSSERNARELAVQAKDLDADAIVAIGAGKLSDTAKNVADMLGVDLIIVPTLACACERRHDDEVHAEHVRDVLRRVRKLAGADRDDRVRVEVLRLHGEFARVAFA